MIARTTLGKLADCPLQNSFLEPVSKPLGWKLASQRRTAVGLSDAKLSIRCPQPEGRLTGFETRSYSTHKLPDVIIASLRHRKASVSLCYYGFHNRRNSNL